MSATDISINPNDPTANAQLTFDDEFNTLNLWNGTSGTWDTNWWYNSITSNGSTLSSNGEQEWYINSNDPATSSVKPWTVDNGVLSIQAQPASSSISSLIDGYSYTSGMLNTYHSFDQTYGLFEARMKLPAGQGFWPAFWLMPENGSWPPELDIMENLGNNTSEAYTTVHSTTLSGDQEASGVAVNNTTQWHTYAVDWEPNYITWYVDGQQVYKVATPSDVDTPMYMILNLAVGGYWPGDANASTNFNQTLQVDWVRVYQSDAELGVGSSGSGTGSTGSSSSSVSHDYNGTGVSQLLIENANGAVVTGQVENGQLAYTQVSLIGPEWTIHGSGDFLGAGQSQFLMENANGAVDIGSVSNGLTTYTQVSSIGPAWTIASTGDYLGNGKAQFLLENTNGALDIGSVSVSSVSGHTATYTQVGSIGPEWSIHGSGDFLGQGSDQFLMENTNGAVVVASVENGQAQYTKVGAVGSEWTVEGSGDFLNNGHDQFMIENTNGAVDVGDVQNGQAVFTQVGALGSTWQFHM
jgi:beta-glucanase (GH16 family)